MFNESIEEIKKLGNELIKFSKITQKKYPFREEYLDKLIERLNTSNEKYIIHLFDLPNTFLIRFNEEGINILKEIYLFLKSRYKISGLYRKYKVNFYLIHYMLISKSQNSLSIKTLKSYIKFFEQNNLAILNINKLEKTVISIGPMGESHLMHVNGLPIDLRKEEWAYLFGVLLESWIKRFKFVAKDKLFAEEINKNLEKVGVKPYFKFKELFHVYGHSVIGNIISIAGLNVNKSQIIANNTIPFWIITKTNKKYHSILLSKILDTEGNSYSKRHNITITQSSHLPLKEDELNFILNKSKKTIIKASGATSYTISLSELSESIRKKVVLNPPLVLISIQILLRKYKINSSIYPSVVYISENNLASINWHLNIQGFFDIKRFYDLCKDFITISYKKKNIEENLSKSKETHMSMNLRSLYYLINAFEIENNKLYFTSEDLFKITKKSKNEINHAIWDLHNLRFIKQIGKESRFRKLVISEDGKSYLINKNINNKEEFSNIFGL
ncbi:MAG: hypothetical protein AABX61_02975 [Nanoarchaeota archaeon]